MCARTLCPLVSSTRNIALGRASRTEPSISMTPSFLAIPSCYRSQSYCWSCGDFFGADARREAAQSTKGRAYAISRRVARRDRLGMLGGRGQPAGFQRGEDPPRDVVDRAQAVDLDEQSLLAEHLEQGGGLALINLLAVPDRVFGVVDAALLDRALTQPPH